MVIEHFILEKDVYNFEKLLTPETRFKFANGMVEIPDKPGIGIEFDPDCLKRYGSLRNA
jgi:L-alanine-DL-glutamate epimerase-like enolase superfamily enzyme